MKSKGILILLLLMAVMGSCTDSKQRTPCTTKEQCLNNPDCLCWCSQICNWRKKTANDHPVYIENDPYGKFCYCKQWDYDHYEDNCINHKGIKEPKDAK